MNNSINFSNTQYYEILPCSFSNYTELCLTPYNQTNNAINYVSLMLQFLHLLLISRMKHLRETKYFGILVSLTLSDMIHSAASILKVSCEMKSSILELPAKASYWLFIIFNAISGSSVLIRYLVLLISSIERYVAVCQPFQYGEHPLVNNTKVIFGVIFISSFLLSTLINTTARLPICQSALQVKYVSGLASSAIYYSMAAIVVLFMLSTAILLAIVWWELRLMVKRSTAADNSGLIAGSRYVIWKFVLHFLRYIPTMLYSVFQVQKLKAAVVETTEASAIIFGSLMRIVSLAAFWYLHPQCVKNLKHVLRFNRCSGEDQPSGNVVNLERY